MNIKNNIHRIQGDDVNVKQEPSRRFYLNFSVIGNMESRSDRAGYMAVKTTAFSSHHISRIIVILHARIL